MSEDLVKRIENFITNGQPLKHEGHSEYRAGNETYCIYYRTTQESDESKLFFGINPVSLGKSDYVIFILTEFKIAFKIPSYFIKEIEPELSKDENGRLLLPLIESPLTKEWLINTKDKIEITEYLIPIKYEDESFYNIWV